MKDFVYNINPYAQIANLLYVKSVLKEIVEQRAVQEYYYLTDSENRPLPNPRVVGNKLVLDMPLPPTVNTDKLIDIYMADHTKVIFNTLLNLDLYGIVRINKKIYINKNFTSEDEGSDYGMIVLSILPDYRKLVFVLAIYMALILSVIYYVNWF